MKHRRSDVLELQFCEMLPSSQLEEIVSTDAMAFKRKDSLFILDDNLFFQEYAAIFDCGYYANMQRGVFDPYGINYYPPELLNMIVGKIKKSVCGDQALLLDWLKKSRAYNGFYILGY